MNQTMKDQNGGDTEELDKFELLADQWWDAEGPLKTLHEINPLRLDYIDSRVPLEGARGLDVGCGGGILSDAMARKGADVVGSDLAQASLEAAANHAQTNGVSLEYICVDTERVAAEQPGSFDIVTCLELLEHVPEPANIVNACARIVRPGGSVFFSTINRNLKSFLMAIVGGEYLLRILPKGTHTYDRLIRPSELASWCRHADLQFLNLSGLHYNPFTNTYWLGGNVHVNYFVHTQRGLLK